MATRTERQYAKDADERQSPHGRVVYRAIYKEGMEELARGNAGLAWSGLAAGLSMGFSLLTESLLRAHLPDAPWRPLVAKLGYSVGFLIIILGRQQLFTENTLTVILPALRVARLGIYRNVLRLWAIVFAANVVGAAIFAIATTALPVLDPAVASAIVDASREAWAHSALEIACRGIFAGWLIAIMVWMMPFAESSRVWIVILLTYVVGLGGFSHVIAGSADAFSLAARGIVSWPAALLHFTLPALAGNTVGGVALVAALGHAQFVEGQDAQDL